MADTSTFIKIDRNIVKWRWYKDASTLRLFLHLIINANITDCDFEEITVHRGQLVTSYPHLANDLGISIKQIRTALNHLKTTGEVAVSSCSKYSVITVLNYNKYQEKGQTKGQTKGSQGADEGQTKGSQGATIKEYKELKNDKNEKNKEALPF